MRNKLPVGSVRLREKESFQDKPWLLVVVLGLATFLRIYQLGHEGLWADEMGSIQDSEDYWKNPGATRPLYFILLNLWMNFGQSDIWLRSLSVLFGVGSVYLTYRLGQRLLSQRVGFLAALLMAVSPLFINHSQEIRMYSLSSFLSLLGTLFLVQTFPPRFSRSSASLSSASPSSASPSLESFSQTSSQNLRGSLRLSLISWAISRWLVILTMPLNILLLLPDALLFGYCTYRDSRYKNGRYHKHASQKASHRYRLFGFGVLFTTAASLPTLLAQTVGGAAQSFLASQAVDYSKPGLLQILGMVAQFSSHWPLRFFLERQFQADLAKNELSDASLLEYFLTHLNGPLIVCAVMTLALLGVLGFALAQIFSRRQAFSFAALAAWGLMPSAAVLAISHVSGSLWFPRYLLGFAPYYLLLLAAGFERLWKWRGLGFAIAIGYSLSVLSSLQDYYGSFPYRNDWKAATTLVTDLEQPGDTIIYYSLPRHYEHSFPRYYEGKNDIYYIDRSTKAETLEVDYIQQNLPPDLIGVDARFWVVCWWYCSDMEAAENIARAIAGDTVVLEKKARLTSLGNHPIHVYLFAPTAQAFDGHRSLQVVTRVETNEIQDTQ